MTANELQFEFSLKIRMYNYIHMHSTKHSLH